jgi:hypothetical protein
MKVLLNGAILLAWMFVAAIVITAPGYLAVTPHEHEASAVIERIPSTHLVEQFPAPSAASASSSASPSSAQSPPSPLLPGARLRFGFLEFEDDPDPPTE